MNETTTKRRRGGRFGGGVARAAVLDALQEAARTEGEGTTASVVNILRARQMPDGGPALHRSVVARHLERMAKIGAVKARRIGNVVLFRPGAGA